MSKLPHDPFNRSRLPSDFDRRRRVELLGRAAEDLLAGRLPDPEARLFLGAALDGWLRNGGRLERDHFRVLKPRSHVTPRVIWRQICAAQNSERAARHDPTDFPDGV